MGPFLRVPACTAGSAVKIDFQALPASQPAVFLQDGNQLHFILHRIEPQAQLGDQVVSIDQVGHLSIVPAPGGLSRARFAT